MCASRQDRGGGVVDVELNGSHLDACEDPYLVAYLFHR